MTRFNIRNRSMCSMLVGTYFLVALGVAAAGSRTSAETKPAGIEVALSPEKRFRLRVTLRSGAEHTTTFRRSELPWGSRRSMIFVAVRPNGRPIKMAIPIDDPTGDKVSLASGASLTEEINLESVVEDISRVVKESDVHLFWAYESPKELRIPRWSGGWVLIPQQK